jgi:hypothetical protein
MAYPEHTLITWGGTWNNLTAETWVCSLRMSGWMGPFEEDQEPLLNAIAVRINAYQNSTAVPSDARLTFIKANPINAAGKYMSQFVTHEKRYDPPINGGNTGTLLPLQLTVAVSLRTDRARGIGSRGRFFSPGVVGSEVSGGLLFPARAGARAQAAKTLVEGLNTVGATYDLGRVSVVSSGSKDGSLPGVAVPVTSVEVGQLVDTQRRRRAQLSEAPRSVLAIA